MLKIGDKVRIVEEVYDREGILKGQTGVVKEIRSSNKFGVYPDILNHPKISDQNWTFDGNEGEVVFAYEKHGILSFSKEGYEYENDFLATSSEGILDCQNTGKRLYVHLRQ